MGPSGHFFPYTTDNHPSCSVAPRSQFSLLALGQAEGINEEQRISQWDELIGGYHCDSADTAHQSRCGRWTARPVHCEEPGRNPQNRRCLSSLPGWAPASSSPPARCAGLAPRPKHRREIRYQGARKRARCWKGVWMVQDQQKGAGDKMQAEMKERKEKGHTQEDGIERGGRGNSGEERIRRTERR